MSEQRLRCARCGKPVRRAIWLEYDNRRDVFGEPGTVPTEHSQGGFALGPACARRERDRQASLAVRP